MNKAKKVNKIGIMSGVTKEFNISKKKRLKDPLVLELDGISCNKSVETWIKEYPQVVFDNFYQNNTGLQFVTEAFQLFKSVLREKHPELIEEIERRKRARRKAKQRGKLYIKPGSKEDKTLGHSS